MKTRTIALFALTLACAGVAPAGIIFDNTSFDTLDSVFYSVGPYTAIGDGLTLGGVDRRLTIAEAQFFNNGSSGTFDATLKFWALTNSTVGAQIGVDYVRTGLAINATDILTVQFSSLDLTVPNEIAFSIQITPITGALDLGLNIFNGSGGAGSAPDVGSSNLSQILVNTGSGLVAGNTPAGSGNLYFLLTAEQPVPEPSTIFLVGSAVLALGAFRKRSRRVLRIPLEPSTTPARTSPAS